MAHKSLNTGDTCMALNCHFGGNPYMEISIDDEGNLCSYNNFMGDHAIIDLTLEQVKELHGYLTDVLKQAGEL